jgi:hypothetical protein
MERAAGGIVPKDRFQALSSEPENVPVSSLISIAARKGERCEARKLSGERASRLTPSLCQACPVARAAMQDRFQRGEARCASAVFSADHGGKPQVHGAIEQRGLERDGLRQRIVHSGSLSCLARFELRQHFGAMVFRPIREFALASARTIFLIGTPTGPEDRTLLNLNPPPCLMKGALTKPLCPDAGRQHGRTSMQCW